MSEKAEQANPGATAFYRILRSAVAAAFARRRAKYREWDVEDEVNGVDIGQSNADDAHAERVFIHCANRVQMTHFRPARNV